MRDAANNMLNIEFGRDEGPNPLPLGLGPAARLIG